MRRASSLLAILHIRLEEAAASQPFSPGLPLCPWRVLALQSARNRASFVFSDGCLELTFLQSNRGPSEQDWPQDSLQSLNAWAEVPMPVPATCKLFCWQVPGGDKSAVQERDYSG
jgi:hypothetical protein